MPSILPSKRGLHLILFSFSIFIFSELHGPLLSSRLPPVPARSAPSPPSPPVGAHAPSPASRQRAAPSLSPSPTLPPSPIGAPPRPRPRARGSTRNKRRVDSGGATPRRCGTPGPLRQLLVQENPPPTLPSPPRAPSRRARRATSARSSPRRPWRVLCPKSHSRTRRPWRPAVLDSFPRARVAAGHAVVLDAGEARQNRVSCTSSSPTLGPRAGAGAPGVRLVGAMSTRSAPSQPSPFRARQHRRAQQPPLLSTRHSGRASVRHLRSR
jgi:hypothetical protein